MIDIARAELLSPDTPQVGLTLAHPIGHRAKNGDPEGIAPDMGRALPSIWVWRSSTRPSQRPAKRPTPPSGTRSTSA